MKRKFVILTLCFTIFFSSLNLNRSYADGGVISLPMLGVVSSLAVGTGIILSSNDDIYDIGYNLYEWVKNHNSLTWQTLQATFLSSVTVLDNNLVSVDSKFLNIIKDFFDNFVGDASPSSNTPLGTSMGVALYPGYTVVHNNSFKNDYFNLYFENNSLKVYYKDVLQQSFGVSNLTKIRIRRLDSSSFALWLFVDGRWTTQKIYNSLSLDGSIPYKGGYTWDNVESKKENESVALPIPGDLGSLVGQGSTDFWDNSDNLVGNNDISIPNVDNPSIGLDGTTSFPNTNVDTDNPSIPDINNPTIDGILPAFPSFGDSLDFSPMYLTNVTEKFPFSLPWDIGRLIQKFDVEPVAPVFEVPVVSETITLDLTEFSELASIVRFFVLVGFILALIFISTKLMA